MGNIPKLTQLPQTQDSPRLRLQPFATAAMGGGAQAAQLAAMGEGMAGVGKTLSAIGDKLLAEKEEADVQGAVAEYREQMREKLYGQNGILTRQGDNAAGATIEAQTEADKLRSDYAKRFATKRAAQAWDRFSNQDVDSIVSRAAQHEAIQTRKAGIEKRQAKLQSDINDMIDVRDNPALVKEKEEEIRRDAQALYGGMLGLPQEVVDAETKRIISSAHAAVIDKHQSAGEHDYAYKYFEEHKDALDSTYVMAQEALLKRGSRSDAILADAYRISQSMPFDEQLKYVQEKYKDADEHDEMMRRVVFLENLRVATDKKAAKALKDIAYNDAIEQADAQNWMWEPPQNLTPTDRASLKSYMMRRYNAWKAGLSDIDDDDGEKRRLEAMAVDDKKAFIAEDLDKYRLILSTNTLNALKRLQFNLATKPESTSTWKSELASMSRVALGKAGYGDDALSLHKQGSAKWREIKYAQERFGRLFDAYTATLKVGDIKSAQAWIDEWIHEWTQQRWFLFFPRSEIRQPKFMFEELESKAGGAPSGTAPGAQAVPQAQAAPPVTEGPPRPRGVPNWPWEEAYKGWVRRVNGKVVMWYDEMGRTHRP